MSRGVVACPGGGGGGGGGGGLEVKHTLVQGRCNRRYYTEGIVSETFSHQSTGSIIGLFQFPVNNRTPDDKNPCPGGDIHGLSWGSIC